MFQHPVLKFSNCFTIKHGSLHHVRICPATKTWKFEEKEKRSYAIPITFIRFVNYPRPRIVNNRCTPSAIHHGDVRGSISSVWVCVSNRDVTLLITVLPYSLLLSKCPKQIVIHRLQSSKYTRTVTQKYPRA